MEFGEKIQKLRNQNKWTQEQLAEKLYQDVHKILTFRTNYIIKKIKDQHC